MSSLTFVHVGDLEPNFRSTKGKRDPNYRPREDVQAVFDCLEHLFNGLRGPGPDGLRKPDVVFFSGDLSGPQLSTMGGSGGANGYRPEFERLFATWQRLVDGGTTFVWTIASHEDSEYRRAAKGEDCWPFISDAAPKLVCAPGVLLTADPDRPLVVDVQGLKIGAIGGLGGDSLKNVQSSDWERNEAKATKRQAKVDSLLKRLDHGIAGLRADAPCVVVSADDQRRGIEKFASYLGLGGVQSTAGRRPPKGSNVYKLDGSNVHKLGRPVDIRPSDGSSPAERLQRLDFVWGEVLDDSRVRALRVLSPAPPQYPDAPAHPKVVAWGAVPWTPSPPIK